MVVTDNEAIAKKCKELRNLCFIPQKRFVHEDIGWNYRMTNLQAALGQLNLNELNSLSKEKEKLVIYTIIYYKIFPVLTLCLDQLIMPKTFTGLLVSF